MRRPVLRRAVQREVGEHDPVAVGELVDDRLPLAVGQAGRVQQRERRSGPRLAIRDPRSVGVVVQPKLHCEPQLSTDTLALVARRVSIGRPVRRREDERILVRRSEFLDDIRRDGMLHMAFVRSPHAYARVRGVRGALWSAADIAGRAVPARVDPPPGLTVADAPHPVLAVDEVRYVGQPVAVVVGETRALGRGRGRARRGRLRGPGRRSSIPARGRSSRAGSSARGTWRARSPPPPTSCAPTT